MADREPVEWIEIDYDFCDLTFGVAPCTAVLGLGPTDARQKCFNTTETCAARGALDLGVLTLRFITPRSNLPKGTTWFPCLDSVSGSSSTVNIAGADDDLAPLGKRAEITAKMRDFTYHDRLTDKYARERVTGAAQADGIGYRPEDHGTFFGKLRARWPFYAGRPLRHCLGYLDGGGPLVAEVTRHFIITNMTVDIGGGVTFQGKDILDLADDKRVQAPKASNARLSAAMTIGLDPVTLAPPGIGDAELPVAGFASIGSEIIAYTRSGDVLTVTQRGVSRTTIATHSLDDTVQPTFSLRLVRIDEAIRTLLVDYAGINPAFIPFSTWQVEVTRWAPTLRLTVDITKPEGVAKLIGELAILGVSIWWDERAQLIGLRMNRPVDIRTEVVKRLSDRDNLISLDIDDRDDERLTTIQFFTVMRDPTMSPTDGNSYLRQRYVADAGAVLPEEFGDSRVKKIYCRWLNHGDDAAVAVLGRRFLQGFTRAPRRYTMQVDARDDMSLVAVGQVETRDNSDATGRMALQTVQIIGRSDKVTGHRVELIARAFAFGSKRYGYFTPNDWPDYAAATETQRERGAFFCDDTTKRMSDGTEPYRFI